MREITFYPRGYVRQFLKRPARGQSSRRVLSIFGLVCGVGIAIIGAQILSLPYAVVHASSADNFMGWIWSDPIGWISVNSDTVSACLTPPCGSYGIHLHPTTKKLNGFAWSDYAGWVCFGSSCDAAPSCAGTTPDGKTSVDAYWDPGTKEMRGWAKVCNAKDEGWVSLNCKEVTGACAAATPYYKVAFDASTGKCVVPSIPGSSFAWNGTSGGAGFGYLDFSKVFIRPEAPTYCTDGIDNNLNGLIDCAEPACCTTSFCSSSPTCAAPTPLTESACVDSLGTPKGVFACCHDGSDNDGNALLDCADFDCQKKEPTCTPAWIQANAGSIYSQKGITSETGAFPSKATYCLSTQGDIQGFESGISCTEKGPTTPFLSLPKSTTGYRGTLGSLDMKGILSGRYGVVEKLPGADITLPAILDGKIYVATGNVTLAATTFLNGSFDSFTGATRRGNGMLVVDGGDLTITGNLTYKEEGLPKALRSLASFGVIVKKKDTKSFTGGSSGGSIFIRPAVTKAVGAFFAEETIATGSAGASDVPLNVFGLMAARQFNLQRNYRSATTPAEVFTFDGRAIANPPPGMQEIGKSLPSSKDAF